MPKKKEQLGIAYTKDNKNFILPAKEAQQLAAKSEVPQAQGAAQELMKKKEELAAIPQKSPTAINAIIPPTPTEIQQKAALENPTTLGSSALGNLGKFVQEKKGEKLYLPEAGLKILTTETQAMFEMFDSFRASLTGGDTTTVTDARGVFNKATTTIGNDIQSVKDGTISPSQAILDFQRAYGTTAQIESQIKTKGLGNLRYWVRSGKDIETEVALNKVELQRLYNDLLAAIETNKQNQIYADQRRRMLESQIGGTQL